jgi:glucokinase
MSVIGIDLGGTKIAAGVFLEGSLRSQVTVPTPDQGNDAVIEAMAQAAQQALERAGILNPVLGVGVGAPGPIDYRAGLVKFAPNVGGGMVNYPVRQALQTALGLPTFLENDANAAALAEHHLGAAQGAGSSLYVTLSTGIGGGFVQSGKVWRGVRSQAAEVGHLTVLPGGPTCGCGLDGCLEALAGGRALEREASYAYVAPVSTPELFRRFQAGEPRACRIVQQAARYVGIGLANLVRVYDPEVIVLGGGMALNGGPDYISTLEAAYHRYLEGWETAPLRMARLGADAGLLGAALTAVNELNLS